MKELFENEEAVEFIAALRIVHMASMRGSPADHIACAIAQKQLHSSHHFEAALGLSFCVPRSDDPKESGFYLIMVMGSEQTGLAGVKGVNCSKGRSGPSVSNRQGALKTIRNTLEGNQ